MCGILGVIDIEELPNDFGALFHKILMTLEHRGPDWQETWSLDPNVYLGHTRLSFLDLSPSGNQPMVSRNGRYIITYNGEVYNLDELKRNLEDSGIFLRSNSDTEIVLESCALLGVQKTASLLNGMFSFCVYDRHEKTVYLVRDRVGIKPLYWMQYKKGVAFSSEIKALSMLFEQKTTLNKMAIELYFNYGYIPAPYSIFEKIYKLPPAAILTFSSLKDISINTYWCVDAELKREASPNYEEFESNLHYLLKDSIKKSLIADVPIGTFLSGGIDSSLVTAVAQNVSKKKISTFTIGFENKKFDEAHYAKKIANFLETDHHELYFTSKDLKQIIPLLPQMYGEPFADSSSLPTHLVSRLAKKEVKAVLSGDGGDEVFAGYNTYNRMKNFYKYLGTPQTRKMFLYILNILHSIKLTKCNKVPFIRKNLEILFKVEQLILKENHIEAYEYLSSFLRDVLLLKNKPNLDILKSEIGRDIVKDIQLIDFKRYLPDDILRKVDGASMFVGLEVRVPLLDHRIIELGFQAPTHFKIKNNKGKYPLRRILSKYIPENLFERPKAGFSIDLAKIIREDIPELANELLLDSSIEDFMDGQLVKHMLKEHQTGIADHKSTLWSIIMFQLWRAENAI